MKQNIFVVSGNLNRRAVMQQVPFKFRIIEYAVSLGRPLTSIDVCRGLKNEYQEKQCNARNIEDIMRAMQKTGILMGVDHYFDREGRVRTRYMVTDQGRAYCMGTPQKS